MSKPIEALRNKSGNIFWPATASDAVIHPKTKKTLTDHITRYDLTEYDTVTSLETGIQKLIGDKSNGGLEVIPKEGDRILVGNWDNGDPATRLPGATEYIYFSEGELDEPGDNYYEYSRCWTEICYDTSDIPRLSSEGRLFSENSPIMILSDIDVSESYLNDPYLIRANLGKYCHLVSLSASNLRMDSISKVISSGNNYVYYKIEKPDTKTIYYSISTNKFYRFIPRSGKTGGMEEIGPKEITGVSINGVITTPNTFGVINLGTIENLQEITWSALKTLRDGGNLEPGKFYRITDYTCTTTQTDTQSAGHVFDIIVLALSESTLSETAWADHHEGDTYFANSNLAAWELKYCLDNDTTRFSWADATNGKGVIYWMKDEWNNECSYDFKNIQFRAAINTGTGLFSSFTNVGGVFLYTFTWLTQQNEPQDCSTIFPNSASSNVGKVYNNNIKNTTYDLYQYYLPFNIFYASYIDSYYFGGIRGNSIGKDCDHVVIRAKGTDITNNIVIGNNCNSIRVSGTNILVGNNCSNITTGTRFDDIIIGNDCTNITLAHPADSAKSLYYQHIIIESHVENLQLYPESTPSYNTKFKNILIQSGISGESSNNRKYIYTSVDNDFLTTYKPANSVEISV